MAVLTVVEGVTDLPFVCRLLRDGGAVPGTPLIQGGHGELDKRVARWNQASNRSEILVVRDHDPTLGRADCAAGLVVALAGGEIVAPALSLRIATRALEAWLLADVESVAQFFSVSKGKIPRDPDDLPDPKLALVNLCRTSKNRRIRTGMVPTRDAVAARVAAGVWQST